VRRFMQVPHQNENGVLVVILKTTSKQPLQQNLTKEQAQILTLGEMNNDRSICHQILTHNSTLQKNNGEWVEVFEYSNDLKKSCSMSDLV
jgi:hypothetical protein